MGNAQEVLNHYRATGAVGHGRFSRTYAVSDASQALNSFSQTAVGAFTYHCVNDAGLGIPGVVFDKHGALDMIAEKNQLASSAGEYTGLVTAIGSLAAKAVVRNGAKIAVERGGARFTSQGFSPAQADYLAAPYEGIKKFTNLKQLCRLLRMKTSRTLGGHTCRNHTQVAFIGWLPMLRSSPHRPLFHSFLVRGRKNIEGP